MDSRIDLDVLERLAIDAEASRGGNVPDSAVVAAHDAMWNRMPPSTVRALIRAVRAAKEESRQRHGLDRFKWPPHDDCYRDHARARDEHAAAVAAMDAAIAPFRGGSDG